MVVGSWILIEIAWCCVVVLVLDEWVETVAVAVVVAVVVVVVVVVAVAVAVVVAVAVLQPLAWWLLPYSKLVSSHF